MNKLLFTVSSLLNKIIYKVDHSIYATYKCERWKKRMENVRKR